MTFNFVLPGKFHFEYLNIRCGINRLYNNSKSVIVTVVVNILTWLCFDLVHIEPFYFSYLTNV